MNPRALLILGVISTYVGVSVVLAWASRTRWEESNDYLNATGSLPTWIASISFLATNCGALEILGLSGIAFRYGVQAFHFYWIGAIPAMIFVSFVILPVYVRSGVHSVPEYLGQRFGPSVRLLNAFTILISTAVYAGISLYALAEVMHMAASWSFLAGISTFASIVLAYVLIGGFRATVYNEVLQFLFMFAGLVPLLYLTRNIHPEEGGEYWHVWHATPIYSGTQQLDLIAVLVGLGAVIGTSYWCTDFALVQRALTARTLEGARRVPLFAGFGKLVFSFIVVTPVVLMRGHLHHSSDAALDETSPSLISTLYGPRIFAVGIVALMAGLLNSLAGNVSAFAALWTQEIYRPFVRRGRSESHYLVVGRVASVSCIAIGISAAFATRAFENLSAFVLLIFSLFVVPFFAVVLMGVLSRQGSTANALAGATAGIVTGGLAQLAFAKAWLPSGSKLEANFYAAIFSFSAAAIVCNLPVARLPGTGMTEENVVLPTINWAREKPSPTLWCLGGILLGACLLANVLWW
jgi:SSS family solute:Na+ symporter